MRKQVVAANTEELSGVLAGLEEFLDEEGVGPKISMQMAIALEEMFVNIAHYAYEGLDIPESDRTAEITLERVESEGEDRIRVTLADGGMPYDPLAKPDPDTTLSAEERQIGGLGIFMVKKSMDHVAYERRDGRNIFTMEKNVG